MAELEFSPKHVSVSFYQAEKENAFVDRPRLINEGDHLTVVMEALEIPLEGSYAIVQIGYSDKPTHDECMKNLREIITPAVMTFGFATCRELVGSLLFDIERLKFTFVITTPIIYGDELGKDGGLFAESSSHAAKEFAFTSEERGMRTETFDYLLFKSATASSLLDRFCFLYMAMDSLFSNGAERKKFCSEKLGKEIDLEVNRIRDKRSALFHAGSIEVEVNDVWSLFLFTKIAALRNTGVVSRLRGEYLNFIRFAKTQKLGKSYDLHFEQGVEFSDRGDYRA